jgi:hypothetical protein
VNKNEGNNERWSYKNLILFGGNEVSHIKKTAGNIKNSIVIEGGWVDTEGRWVDTKHENLARNIEG